MTAYKRLTLYDRMKIEEGLDGGLSFRAIADSIGRSPSTVSREVRENRTRRPSGKAFLSKCREAGSCSERGRMPSVPSPGIALRGMQAERLPRAMRGVRPPDGLPRRRINALGLQFLQEAQLRLQPPRQDALPRRRDRRQVRRGRERVQVRCIVYPDTG